MADLKQKKVDVTELKLGMFVSALDRPWSQTSFPLQGFPLRSNREITAIRSICQYVYIDVDKSRNLPPEILNTKQSNQGNYRHTQVPLELNHQKYTPRTERPSGKEIAKARESFEKASVKLLEVREQIKAGASVSESQINETAGVLVQSALEHPVAVTWMALLQRNDSGSYAHSLRAATWGLLCARHMGLEEADIKRLAAGIMLKDVYRTEADELLPETKVIEKTVEKLRVAKVHAKVISVVKYHREKFNGTGAPYGISGEKIPLLARIAAIATQYDELIFPQNGDQPIAPSAATRYLYEQRGRAFQDELVIEFIECIGLYPLGTLVKLNTGETACVVKANPKRRLRPEVMVVRNGQGLRLKKPARADLAGENSMHRKIESDLPADPDIDTTWIYENFLTPQGSTESTSRTGGGGRMFKLFS